MIFLNLKIIESFNRSNNLVYSYNLLQDLNSLQYLIITTKNIIIELVMGMYAVPDLLLS